MSEIKKIGLIGLGEVGSRLAEDLLMYSQAQIVIWDNQFGVAGSKPEVTKNRLKNETRLTFAQNAETMAQGCQLIISAVTADQNINACKSILAGIEPQTWMLDINSVSPSTKCKMFDLLEHVKGRYVEAAVMSPIDPLRIKSPILLAGPHADAFLAIGQALGFSGMSFCSASLGKAAATKMCRSIVIKGMESLVTESMLSAKYYGVEEDVLSSLNNLFPRSDWPAHAKYLISRSLEHGIRRAEEMREVAKTVSDAGLEPLMSSATAQRQDWAAQFSSALNQNQLQDMLIAIRAQLQQNDN